ncbi:MAG: IS21-like element helper ATPase IstB [Anaerolineales bacterium]
MSSRQILFDQLAVLRMPAFRQALEEQFTSPHYEELPFEERLTLLLEEECTQREHNRIQRRIRKARFQQSAWVQDLDFSARRGLERQQILQLAQTTWITKALNLIILGPTGSGKTFLACALGRAACQHDRVVRFFRLPRFFQEVKTAQMEGEYPRFLKTLTKTDLLIFDDWLRDPLSLAEAQTLLDILDDRYGRQSTLVAAQFPISTWHTRLPDPTLADAILDRLVHNAYRIELNGESQRKLRAESTMSSTNV